MTQSNAPQSGILRDVPLAGRYLMFRMPPSASGADVLDTLGRWGGEDDVLVGIGPLLVAAVNGNIPGLRELPALTGHGVASPCTPQAALCWVQGDSRGDVLLRSRAVIATLESAGLELAHAIDGFKHREGRDLTGYVDGTENPVDDPATDDLAATNAAIVANQGQGLDGSSFLALQVWHHDLDRFDAHTDADKDAIIGRRIADNTEIDDAPESAHVKRTAQEDFDPEAFVVRRSMPWSDATGAGLVFTAFGASLDAFDALMRRMVGLDDGIVDALFRFTHPVLGAAFWCPPLDAAGDLDLSALLGERA